MTEKEREQLITLCDEIAQMVPSHTLRDSSTEQFKQFIELLKKKVRPQEIDAIIKAYHYFNTLMGEIKPDTNETKDSQVTKVPEVSVPVPVPVSVSVPAEVAAQVSVADSTSETEEIIELLLNLSQEPASTS